MDPTLALAVHCFVLLLCLKLPLSTTSALCFVLCYLSGAISGPDVFLFFLFSSIFSIFFYFFSKPKKEEKRIKKKKKEKKRKKRKNTDTYLYFL